MLIQFHNFHSIFLKDLFSQVSPFLSMTGCHGGSGGSNSEIITFRREEFVCSDVFMLQAHRNFANILEKKMVKFYFQEQKTLRNSVYKPKKIVYTECSRNIMCL